MNKTEQTLEALLDAKNQRYQLEKALEDHECVYEMVDCDLCSRCKEHADFCEECGSNCCGARPVFI